MSVSQDRLRDRVLELCAIDATTGQEADSCAFLYDDLKQHFEHVETLQVGDTPGRYNILAYDEKPRILLTSHIDTVPPFIPPRFEDGILHGRGVCDAKGIVICMIEAALILKSQGHHDVGLLFVVGEETNSDGAKAAAQGFAPKVDFFINGEPTELKMGSSMKGVCAFKLSVQGIAGHSAYPEIGRSATHQLVADLARLKEHPWPNHIEFGQTTLNIGSMQGGVAGNVIAPHAEAHIVVRTTIAVEEIEQQIRQCIHPDTHIEFLTASSPMRLHTVSPFPQTIVSFGSDIPHLRELGTAILYGPGSILDAHTDHEHVRLDDLVQATQTYIDLVDLLPKLS